MRRLYSSTGALLERGAGQAADLWGLKKVPQEGQWPNYQVLAGNGRLPRAY